MVTVADISSIAATPSKRRHKTFNEENKQFDPGGQGEKARLGTRLYSTSISGQSWEAPCCFLLCASSVLCMCPFFPEICFSSQVMTSQRDVRGDADKSLMYATGGQAFSRLLPYLKMARASNARFGRSADALG